MPLQAMSSTCPTMTPSCAPRSTAPTGGRTWWRPRCQTSTSSSRGRPAPPWWSPPSWTTATVSVCWTSPSDPRCCPSLCPGPSTMPTNSAGWPLARILSTVPIWVPRARPCGARWPRPMACWCVRLRTFPGLMGRRAGVTAPAWLDSVWLRAKLPNTRSESKTS